jgi:hypothetical protein
MMGAESTRNMYSNFAVNNKDDCLKPHHVGYLINRVMMHGTTNEKLKFFSLNSIHSRAPAADSTLSLQGMCNYSIFQI